MVEVVTGGRLTRTQAIEQVIRQLGATPIQRRRRIEHVYRDAQVVIPWEWTGLPG